MAFVKVSNDDAIELMKTIRSKSIDLILIDPPYIISKDSGMNKLYNTVESNRSSLAKTEEDWEEYKKKNNMTTNRNKNHFLKYGSIYGKKYSTKTDFGDWDNSFTLDSLEEFVSLSYDKLRSGGTLIVFFDIWKISYLKEILEKYKFKQIRFIEWIKSNPMPINSNTNYLSNSREIALTCVKDSKPTFNSKYDNGVYSYPIQSGKSRNHPTQKNLKLIEDLIEKHSNPGDTVVDAFLGSGTTAFACKNLKRNFIGCELNKEYYDRIIGELNAD